MYRNAWYRWCVSAGVVPPRRVPNGPSQSTFPNQDLPPQHWYVSLYALRYFPYIELPLDKLGRICLDILKGKQLPWFHRVMPLLTAWITDKWSPALQIRTVLLSIQALLSAPNPDDPLATDVAKHYKENEKDAQRVSREWTEQYASA